MPARVPPMGCVADAHCGLAALHDVVGVTAGATHRHAYYVALLLKKASAGQGEWDSAYLKPDRQGYREKEEEL